MKEFGHVNQDDSSAIEDTNMNLVSSREFLICYTILRHIDPYAVDVGPICIFTGDSAHSHTSNHHGNF